MLFVGWLVFVIMFSMAFIELGKRSIASAVIAMLVGSLFMPVVGIPASIIYVINRNS